LAGKPGKNRVGFQNFDHRLAEFTAVSSRHNFASELVGNKLQSVADAQNGKSGVKELGGQGRAACPAYGIGTPREDNAGRMGSPNFLDSRIVGHNLAIYRQLADPASNELSILRTKIQNQDVFAVNGLAPGSNLVVTCGRVIRYLRRLLNSTETNKFDGIVF
jgi:hypothetical protein